MYEFGMGKTRTAGLQSAEGRMMIDSVVWAQYINVTDRHTDRQTDTQTATSHCVGRQKLGHRLYPVLLYAYRNKWPN